MEIDVALPVVYNVAVPTNNYNIQQSAGVTVLIVPTPGPPGPAGASGDAVQVFTELSSPPANPASGEAVMYLARDGFHLLTHGTDTLLAPPA